MGPLSCSLAQQRRGRYIYIYSYAIDTYSQCTTVHYSVSLYCYCANLWTCACVSPQEVCCQYWSSLAAVSAGGYSVEVLQQELRGGCVRRRLRVAHSQVCLTLSDHTSIISVKSYT